jgi:TPR repeat protein
MNRLKKAFSLDYKDQGSSSTDQSNRKRFSLFKTNSRANLPRLSISHSEYTPALGSAIEIGNRHSQQILDYRPKSAHYDAASFISFNTTTTTTTNTTTTQNRYASMQSINSDLLTRGDDTDKDAYLQLGMKYHEKGELEKATHYWRLAAESGSPLGLFFYGIALRHGWGCKRNPAKAVQYLQSAAESAVHDLQTGIAQSASVAKSELVLAIYELGVCFRHGWGVCITKIGAIYDLLSFII